MFIGALSNFLLPKSFTLGHHIEITFLLFLT